ncbi:MAG: BREX-1 system adenine-specific DNA-methyltransferase PglX [Oscillospiraceae bacterium]
MNKTAIKNFAVWAREKLISDITYKAGMLGISENGIAEKLPQSTNDLQFFDIGTKDYAEVSGKEISQRDALVKAINQKEKDTKNYKEAFYYVVEEVAYTWFNRLIAIRFMEVNDYLPSGIRVLSSENKAKNEPDFVTTPFDTDLEFTPYEQDRVIQLKDENKLDELFRMLFIKQCNKLHDILPELFEKTDDYTELLLTISFTDKDGIVHHLVHDIDEDDFNIDKEGQIEIIGWLYQYYNTEPKDTVFANLKKNIKISKENIAPATQLFTPDWIVRYMVENSLGRLWLEGHPESELKKEWKYYLDEAEQTEEVQIHLAEIRESRKQLNPEQIRFIDPCMGSGHILVYAFDVLMQIYLSCGYTERDAAQNIVRHNLWGLDLDKRAYQLAYFALMMKARRYDRRFLTRGIKLNIAHFQGLESVQYANVSGPIKAFAEQFKDCDTYGSLTEINEVNGLDEALSDFTGVIGMEYDKLQHMTAIYKTLTQKYDVVCTNPPYMGGSGMNSKLSDFVKKNYPDSKSDLSTCFMEKCESLCKINGFYSMINIPVWMFLSSYEKLRSKILKNNSYINMVHFGRGVFGSDFGTTSFVISKNRIDNYVSVYRRLFEKQGAVDSIEQKEKWFFEGKGYYTATQENFSKIPGSPVAYWVSENFIRAYNNGVLLGSIADSKQGIATADNNRYLREWFEVEYNNIKFDCYNHEESKICLEKWYPYNKGGEFRKWYGNNDFVVNWKNDGCELRNDKKAVLRNPNYYFRQCFSWSLISSSVAAFRYKPVGHLFDVAGMSCFSNDKLYYLLAFCNSNFAMEVLKVIAPTINYQCGDIANLPVIYDESKKEDIDNIVNDNITVSKTDWDSYETSWDFKRHPLIVNKQSKALWGEPTIEDFKNNGSIELSYDSWKSICEYRFQKLKANEEELNRIFIEIYGLQDELTPEVEDKDVTVHCIFDTKEDVPENLKGSNYVRSKHDEIVSFISYAVGCMLGRYSLDVEGLAYAGGEWDDSKYKTFIPDADNCIPITDEEYFEDDIVGLFCAWLKKVYGEDTLEENLDFIAKALGNKGKTSREVIRNYFLSDFIKDHIKTYKKRPIYWLFDSGKQNGFKALVYMHRWNADTIGNVRVEYLHRIQRVYEKEILRMQEIIDNSHDNKEISNATKRKEKLQKQIKETKDYDTKIAHLALSRIDIDLDDGVKVNYEKVQTADGKKMQILAKI